MQDVISFHNGGLLYLLLGSSSGFLPGQPLGALTLPLNPDVYFGLTLSSPDSTLLQNSFGVLDAQGQARIGLVSPLPGFGAAAIGQVLHHAGLVLDPAQGGAVVFVSNPLALGLVP